MNSQTASPSPSKGSGSEVVQAVVLGQERKLETCFEINTGGGEVALGEKNQSQIAAVVTAGAGAGGSCF